MHCSVKNAVVLCENQCERVTQIWTSPSEEAAAAAEEEEQQQQQQQQNNILAVWRLLIGDTCNTISIICTYLLPWFLSGLLFSTARRMLSQPVLLNQKTTVAASYHNYSSTHTVLLRTCTHKDRKCYQTFQLSLVCLSEDWVTCCLASFRASCFHLQRGSFPSLCS